MVGSEKWCGKRYYSVKMRRGAARIGKSVISIHIPFPPGSTGAFEA
jgi:hypothetical protein